MFYVDVCLLCVPSEENTPLDLDDHGGRTFLRVLLHLTMHDYPPLVSRALQLLFRHFSQRQEVLQAFKQVTQTAASRLGAQKRLKPHQCRNWDDVKS